MKNNFNFTAKQVKAELLRRIERELTIRKARESLAEFVKLTKDDYKFGWFNLELCRVLERFAEDIENHKDPRLVIEAPPRHGKSELVSVRFPAWLLGKYPKMQIINASYALDLASGFNRQVQAIMDSDIYHEIFPEVFINGEQAKAYITDQRTFAQIKLLKKTSDYFEVYPGRGYMNSAGIGTGITGKGAICMICDDPFKDREEADSETIRRKVWDWFTSTFRTRLAEGGGIIVMNTRWHPIKDDTPVLTTKGWKTHGELQIGDHVYGIDGKPVKVVNITPPVWCDVAVSTNYETIVCSKTHLWGVKSRSEYPVKVLEAGDLIGKERYIPDIQPLDFGRNDELPIDPYWLGLWLGDGSKSAPMIKCWHKFQQHCRNTVYTITREAKDSHGDLFLFYCFQGLRKKLVDLNLLNNKHIPDIYLYSSVENRLKLLAGLMDTDGEVSGGHHRFSNTNMKIYEGTKFLIRSLGMQVFGDEKVNADDTKLFIQGRAYTRHGICYRFSFRPTMDIPTKIPYKAIKAKKVYHRIIRFNNAPEELQGYGRCITTTAKDGLYLVGKTLIPTHNTDDLTGRLLRAKLQGSGEPYYEIKYPAIATEDEEFRKEGEALFPERFSLSSLQKLKMAVGSRDWSALYQQNPIPDEGGLFKPNWIQYYDELPQHYDKAVMSWDMTFKDTKTSDYVCGQVWVKEKSCYYLVDQIRGRFDFTTTLKKFIEFSNKHPYCKRKLIEDKANGTAVINTLKKHISGIVAITPKESKVARASATSTLWEAHNIYIPDKIKNRWVELEYEDELLKFPGGLHDDQVDCTSQALNDLMSKQEHIDPSNVEAILRGFYG